MIFLYDADCGFCTSSVARLRPLFPRVELRSSYSVDLSTYGLTEHDVQEKAWLIDDEHTYGGGAAITGLLRSHGAPGRAAARVLATKPASIMIEAIYRLVAHNRYRLPGATDSCRL